MSAHFSSELFRFLTELRANNNREWFLVNRDRYDADARDPCLKFISGVGPRLRAISRHIVADARPSGGSLFRIYRDVRFSKDKSPYKTHAGIRFRHGGETKGAHVPGFYLRLEPGGSFAGAGLWHPDPAALKKVRDAIVARPQAWRAVLASKPPLDGDALRRPPQGYPPDHPFIADLKRKDFVTTVAFTNAQVLSSQFLPAFIKTCRSASPLLQFLTRALGLPW